MNVHDDYERKMEYISMFNGITLNVEEKLKLEIAFNELQNKIKSEELWFWGKITGSDADYFITLAINFKGHYEFPQKTFYFCTSQNYTFELLQPTFDYHDKDFLKYYISVPLTGNPQTILEKYIKDEDNQEGNVENNNQDNIVNEDNSNEKKFNPNDPDESMEIVPKTEIKKENFTEMLKISYIVRNIDHDTNVFPQGAFRLVSIHELRRNDSFKGLKPEEMKDFSKFHHFRQIVHKKNKELVETDEAILRYDFLDSIQDDNVKGSWSIVVDPIGTMCNIRSLLWPGYYAIHKANTNIFCGVYFGNGLKNFDLPFMV